jgi:hypothetical protein
MNPPPLQETNPSPQFGEKFSFEDNCFANNVIAPGPYQSHTKWTWQKTITGRPVAVVMMGLVDAVQFKNNDFYPAEQSARGAQIYFREFGRGRKQTELLAEPAHFQSVYPKSFKQNREVDPLFANPQQNDFRPLRESPLIDGGAFLTMTSAAAENSQEMAVEDTNYFYDGFRIPGEQGDLIQVQGHREQARVKQVKYEKRELVLDRPLSWRKGEGVALAYTGDAPDIGAFEFNQPATVGPLAKAKGKR